MYTVWLGLRLIQLGRSFALHERLITGKPFLAYIQFEIKKKENRAYWCIVLGKVPNRVYGTSWIWNTKTEAPKGFSLLAQMDFHYLCMSLILDLMTWYSFMCTWLIWQPFGLSEDLMGERCGDTPFQCVATANFISFSKKKCTDSIKQ